MALPQTVDEKLAHADQLREEGNAAFRNGDLRVARMKYAQIFAFVNGLDTTEAQASLPITGMLDGLGQSRGDEITDDHRQRIRLLRLGANANLALVELKRERWMRAVQFARAALDVDPQHVKSHFRCGLALLELNDLDAAKECFDMVHALDPENAALPRAVQKLNRKVKEQRQREANLYRGAFGSS